MGSSSVPYAAPLPKPSHVFAYTDDKGRKVFERRRYIIRGKSEYRWWHGAGKGWVQPLDSGWARTHGKVINYDRGFMLAPGSPHTCESCQEYRDNGPPGEAVPGLDLVPFMLDGLPDLILNLPAADVVAWPEGETDRAKLAEATSEVCVAHPYGVARPTEESVRWFRGWDGTVLIVMDNDDNGAGHSGALHRLEALRAVGVDAYVVKPPDEYKDIREYLESEPPEPGATLLDLDLFVVPESELRDRARDFRSSGQEYRDWISNAPLDGEWEPAQEDDEDEETSRPKAQKIEDKMLDWNGILLQQPRRSLVQNLLDYDSLSRFFGASGSMKSFIMFDLAAHIALGWDWCGHRTRRAPVVYLAAEGAIGMRYRAMALRQKLGIGSEPVPNFRMYPGVIPVATNGKSGPDIAGLWHSFIDILARQPQPGLVILDTQARISLNLSENDNKDMSVMVEALDEMKETTHANVSLIHHSGHENGDRSRGHSAVFAAMDHEFMISRSKGGVLIETKKQKDHAHAEPIGMQAQPVPVGIDEWGDVVESVYLEHDPDAKRESLDIDKKHKAMQALAESSDGMSQNDLCVIIGGRKQKATDVLTELKLGGYIALEKRGQAHWYTYVKDFDVT